MNLPYWVYVLRSDHDGNLYIGFTTDLDERLKRHSEGVVSATAPRRPLRLIYCENHRSKQDALRRESYFKTSAGKKALKLMLRHELG